MSTTQLFVNLAGLTAIAWIVWYFWLHSTEGARAVVNAGVQVIGVTVKGGYHPSAIVAQAGRPVRLEFTRRESSLCSETVVFEGLGRSATLPEGETVPIEFVPTDPGEIPFQCTMGMLRGKVVVTE